MKRFALILVLSLFALPAFSSSITGAIITKVEVTSTGHYYIYFNNTISGSPSCAANTGYVVDGTTVAGGVVTAISQGFYAMGTTITASGTGQCNVDSGYETLADIHTT